MPPRQVTFGTAGERFATTGCSPEFRSISRDGLYSEVPSTSAIQLVVLMAMMLCLVPSASGKLFSL